MKVLLDAVDSWNTDVILSQDEEEDTDSSSADESAREWIKLILLGNSGTITFVAPKQRLNCACP